MSDDIWIKHNLGTFQQPYIFQQNRNRQSPTIAQKVAQQPAIARQPSTYVKQSPYSFRNPVSYQEPNIRNAQSPYIANGQSPYIANRQNPFIRNGQTPFTYNYRSPGTYRNPVSYQLPFTYNYRSPGTYRASVSRQSPYIASFQSPYIYTTNSPYFFTDVNETVNFFSGQSDDSQSIGGESESSVNLLVQIYKEPSGSYFDIIVAAQLGLVRGTSGNLEYVSDYLGPNETTVYNVNYSSGGGITTTGTDPSDNVYELDDALSSSYTVTFVDNADANNPGGLSPGLTLSIGSGFSEGVATAIPTGVNNALNFTYQTTSFNGSFARTQQGSFFALTFAASGQTTYTYNGFIQLLSTSTSDGPISPK